MQSMPILLVILLVLSGCTSLPRSGPMVSDVAASAAADAGSSYEVFDISGPVLAAVRQRGPGSFTKFGDGRRSSEPTLGVGDTVSVTIWEAPGGILFASNSVTAIPATGSHGVTLPDQVIGRDGALTVPFTDRIRVVGQTTRAVEKLIQKALDGKTSNAQVLVNITKPVSNTVTVTGEVANGARVPLSVGGDRILDIIAASGGLKAPINETYVELTRGDTVARVPLLRVTSNPRENIYLRPNDVVTLVRAPQKFLAYGATGNNAEIPFDADGITLAEALAKAGGLLDHRSDPDGVFVFRYESSSLVRMLRPGSVLTDGEASVPVIYRLSMRSPDGFFLAQRFPIRNRDVVYVSSAPFTDVQKVLGVVNSATGYAIQGAFLFAK